MAAAMRLLVNIAPVGVRGLGAILFVQSFQRTTIAQRWHALIRCSLTALHNLLTLFVKEEALLALIAHQLDGVPWYLSPC